MNTVDKAQAVFTATRQDFAALDAEMSDMIREEVVSGVELDKPRYFALSRRRGEKLKQFYCTVELVEQLVGDKETLEQELLAELCDKEREMIGHYMRVEHGGPVTITQTDAYNCRIAFGRAVERRIVAMLEAADFYCQEGYWYGRMGSVPELVNDMAAATN